MYQGFNGFPQPNNTAPKQNMNAYYHPYQEANSNEFQYYDESQYNNFRPPNFQGQNERIQVPSHVQFLFNSADNPAMEQKNSYGFGGGSGSFDGGHQQQVNMPQNSTAFGQFQGFVGRSTSQNDHMNNNYGFPIEVNTSNMSGGNSRNISLNNTSSNNTSQRMDSLPSDRRNTSLRVNANLNDDGVQPINDDIALIERIEPSLNKIIMNYNKICPFCSQVINIRQCNFQNTSAFFSNSSNKYYLTHYDCFLKSKTDGLAARILSLSNVNKVSVKTMLNALSNTNPQASKKISPKAYFISLEGYHPISSYLLFKIDRLCNTIEQTNQNSQILRIDFSKKSTSIFEPNQYRIPFNEFKMVVTVHLTHSDEDAYTFDFLVDLSPINITPDQVNKFIETLYSDGTNQMTLGAQIVYDAANAKGKNDVSLDTSSQSLGAAKPEFGTNVFLALKQFSTSFPLTRNERGKSTTSLEANSRLKQQMSPTQIKPNSKLNLNPNAPLFGNLANNPLNKLPNQQNPQQLFPQNMQQGEAIGYNQQSNQRGSFNQNTNQGNANPSFNAPLFPPNFVFEQDKQGGNFQNMGYPDNDSSPQNNAIPPGLGRLPSGAHGNFPSQQQQFFANQQFLDNSYERKGSHDINNSGFNKPTSVESFEDSIPGLGDRPATPDSLHQVETDTSSNMRGRVKPHITNLYTAVLGRNRKDSSLSNSPSLNKIQNQYFSNVSTPQSAYDPNPISGLPNKFFPPEFHNDGEDNSANVPLTEEMIDNFKLEDYRGQLTEFAKTYNGSRILQKFFPKANQQEIDIFIHEIQDKIDELMLDPYANYMFQTLAQSCSSEQRYYLLQKIAPSMIRIARDRKGTHSLQAVVSLINRDVEEQLIRSILDGHIPELSFDAQATHLIQKLVVSLSINNVDFIYEPVIQKFPEFANNSFGLCVLKQLMTKVEKVPQMKQRIIDLLYANLEDLIQNPFGNYAVQHALDVYPQGCEKILDKIIEKIVQYSNQKFSSNVIEKCFMNTTPEYKKKFVNEITKSDRLVELMKNKYGNYVILKILSTSELEEKKQLAQSLLRNVNLVNVPKYKNRWIQFLEENPMKIPSLNAQTVKPSLFKTSSGFSDSDNSPRTSEGGRSYNNNNKKNTKDLKEEKSQFYHDRNKGGHHYPQRMNNPGQNWGEDAAEDYSWNNNYQHQHQQQQQSGFEAKPNAGGYIGSGKKNKSHNDKFYEKNQHHTNKGGYNNFY